MSLTVREMTAADFARWEGYVAAHPQATFFHRPGWKRVIEASFGQACPSLCAERHGQIVGILPLAHYKSALFGNALISNGACMGGGPLADDDAAYDALDQAAIALLHRVGASYIEYRRPLRRHADWAFKDDLYANFERPLAEKEDDNLKQIPRKQRADVRKTLDNAALSDVLDDSVDVFHALYAESVRNLGTPVFAKKYFRNLKAEFGADCDILNIFHEGRPVSGVLSFYFRDKVMPYYAGASGNSRGLRAADFMYWRLGRRAVERGYRVFDFGRSKVGTGPYAFKKNWGFEPEPIVHEFYLPGGGSLPEVNPTNPKYRLMISVWKKLPLPVANLLGPLIVRNIG